MPRMSFGSAGFLFSTHFYLLLLYIVGAADAMAAMIPRALLIWLGILLLANINGAVRELWLIPALGPTPGRALSTILLSGLVFLVSWLSITWIAPLTPRDALLVGSVWLVLTALHPYQLIATTAMLTCSRGISTCNGSSLQLR